MLTIGVHSDHGLVPLMYEKPKTGAQGNPLATIHPVPQDVGPQLRGDIGRGIAGTIIDHEDI